MEKDKSWDILSPCSKNMCRNGWKTIFCVYREWGNDEGSDDERQRTRAEKEAEKAKNQRHQLIMNEFKKRRVDVRMLFLLLNLW